VKIVRKRDALLTIYELALPLKALPRIDPDEAILEGTVIVSDDDGKGFKQYARWTSGILPNVDGDFFGKIFFERP